MQVELLERKRWRTRIEISNAIFEYLEVFSQSLAPTLGAGMLTPVECEARHQNETAA